MIWFDWCQVIDWYDALDENDICPSGKQLIKIDNWYDVYDIVVNWWKDDSLLSYHDW